MWVRVALVAAGSSQVDEAVGEHAASEVGAELALDAAGQGAIVGGAGVLEEGLEVLADDATEEGPGGPDVRAGREPEFGRRAATWPSRSSVPLVERLRRQVGCRDASLRCGRLLRAPRSGVACLA